MSPSDPRRESLHKVSEEPHTLQGAWVDQNPDEHDEAIDLLNASAVQSTRECARADGNFAFWEEALRERDTALAELAEARAECGKHVPMDVYGADLKAAKELRLTVDTLAEALRAFTDEPKSLGDLKREYRRKTIHTARSALARLDGGKEPRP